MKLKKKIPEMACAASGCKESEDLTGYAAGMAFDESLGNVFLCSTHIYELERERQTAPAKIVDADRPVRPHDERLASAILATVPSGPDVDQAALVQEADEARDVLAMVKEFQIVAQGDMDFANECLADVKGKIRAYKAKKEEATKPLNAALKAIRGWFGPVEDFYGQAEDIWKAKIGAWTLAEAERQRQALEAVQVAHRAGDVAGVAQAMAIATQATVSVPTNVTVRAVWSFEVETPDLVPREYCSPDDKKIRTMVMASDGAPIPGVRIWKDTAVSQRKIV